MMCFVCAAANDIVSFEFGDGRSIKRPPFLLRERHYGERRKDYAGAREKDGLANG